MTDKERTSITVDPDVYEFLSQAEVNQSGLINELVREYKDNQDRQVAALELRYRHLQQEHEEYQEKAETRKEQAEEVKELLEEAKAEEIDGLEEAREALKKTPKEEDNPAIQNWADRLGLRPGQLIDRL